MGGNDSNQFEYTVVGHNMKTLNGAYVCPATLLCPDNVMCLAVSTTFSKGSNVCHLLLSPISTFVFALKNVKADVDFVGQGINSSQAVFLLKIFDLNTKKSIQFLYIAVI